MTFTNDQLAAIIKNAFVMANADGKVEEMELTQIAVETARFNVSTEKFEYLLNIADKMDPAESIRLIRAMSNTEKRYVAAYLGSLMAIDGNIDEKEIAIWTLLSTLCDLPTMNVAEAISIMQTL